MSMATRVVNYLVEQDVPYEVVGHPHSSTALETAQLAHVPGDCLAKSVLLEDEIGYVLAVLPASCRLDMGELHRQTNRNLGLATEPEMGALFEDCEPGALPPFASIYEMEAIVDDTLAEQLEVYFEAGDHEQLVHVSGETFQVLMGEAQYSRFGRHL